MITRQEYDYWKPLIEEYELAEFNEHSLEGMFCAHCQAIDEHDCFCTDHEDEEEHQIGEDCICGAWQNGLHLSDCCCGRE